MTEEEQALLDALDGHSFKLVLHNDYLHLLDFFEHIIARVRVTDSDGDFIFEDYSQ